MDADGRQYVRQLYWAGDFTIRELACVFKVSRTSILRYLQEVGR
ncbi:helix-turn-helix domain-containing protein [Candidatus Micrarchaeota archaeon]|nr:helix-turn-helix domain-containing protein [Candidatus Micrarchaeota archaeon]